MHRLILALLAALALPAGATPATPAAPRASHCSADERPVFECSTGKKTASLCASRSPADGLLLQYRFGVPSKKPELVYPATPQPATRHFHLSRAGFSGGGELHIRFETARHEYILFERTVRTGFDGGENRPEFSRGIAVRRDGKLLSTRPCAAVPGKEVAWDATALDALPEENFRFLDE